MGTMMVTNECGDFDCVYDDRAMSRTWVGWL